MIQDLQVVMMYVVRCKNYTVSCVRTFLRTSLLLEFSRNFDLRVNMIIIQYGIVLNLYVYARFDWQIIFARRNDRSRERKKNHGSRASFRMCGTRVNNFSIKKKTKKTTGDPRVPARFVTILQPIHAVGCLLYGSPTPLGKTRL